MNNVIAVLVLIALMAAYGFLVRWLSGAWVTLVAKATEAPERRLYKILEPVIFSQKIYLLILKHNHVGVRIEAAMRRRLLTENMRKRLAFRRYFHVKPVHKDSSTRQEVEFELAKLAIRIDVTTSMAQDPSIDALDRLGLAADGLRYAVEFLCAQSAAKHFGFDVLPNWQDYIAHFNVHGATV